MEPMYINTDGACRGTLDQVHPRPVASIWAHWTMLQQFGRACLVNGTLWRYTPFGGISPGWTTGSGCGVLTEAVGRAGTHKVLGLFKFRVPGRAGAWGRDNV